MVDIPVGEPLETKVSEPPGSLQELASVEPGDEAAIAARYPLCLAAWAALGESALAAEHPVSAYAYFRVGYHRGLDRIRQAGWRGSGKVPWAHEGNQGFLRCLAGLSEAAGRIGEEDERARCAEFLEQLAPDAPNRGA
jgi:hypothetical protein